MSPNYQALVTIAVLAAAYSLVGLNADAEGSLCVCAAAGGQENGGADPSQAAAEREGRRSTRDGQTARILG